MARPVSWSTRSTTRPSRGQRSSCCRTGASPIASGCRAGSTPRNMPGRGSPRGSKPSCGRRCPGAMADLRVLYVNQTAQVSGAERSLLTLIGGLKGGQVEPVVACPEGELSAEVRALGIESIPIRGTQASFRLHPLHTSRGLLEMAQCSLQVRRIVKQVSPDLVHANTTRAALLALLARDRSGPPTVAHIRDLAPPGRMADLVLSLVARRADVIVANSAYVADRFVEERGRVRVIHNPIDLDRFDPMQAD